MLPQTSDSYSMLSSPVSEPELLHRQPTDSTFPAELEAGSFISLIDSELHKILVRAEFGSVNTNEKQSGSVQC